MRLLKWSLFFVLILLATGCVNPPEQQPAARGNVADRLEALCRLITGKPADKNKVILAFTTIDPGFLWKGTSIPDASHPGFYPDSVYTVLTAIFNPDGTPITKRTLGTWHRNGQLYYELSFNMESRYHTDAGGQPVFENPRDSLQLSHALLANHFGAAHPVFPEGLQPKESHYDYYTYINPQTRDTAFIRTRSFMSPASGYNIIYNLSINSSALNPEPAIR
ncbi:hypothetical protein [Niabella hirudinis]|uniref:hypothetical protein n=1 Tax=Niabella hirudinis TaxID=1285929 RepID=UPI003EC0F8F6